MLSLQEIESQLPKVNEVASMPKVVALCRLKGLDDLAEKILKDPPKHPFKSDGCSCWFQEWNGISMYSACFFHDVKYWCGYPGEEVARLIADAELMIDVATLLNSTTMAETMFHGVRVGGASIFKQNFSWGFGR